MHQGEDFDRLLISILVEDVIFQFFDELCHLCEELIKNVHVSDLSDKLLFLSEVFRWDCYFHLLRLPLFSDFFIKLLEDQLVVTHGSDLLEIWVEEF